MMTVPTRDDNTTANLYYASLWEVPTSCAPFNCYGAFCYWDISSWKQLDLKLPNSPTNTSPSLLLNGELCPVPES